MNNKMKLSDGERLLTLMSRAVGAMADSVRKSEVPTGALVHLRAAYDLIVVLGEKDVINRRHK